MFHHFLEFQAILRWSKVLDFLTSVFAFPSLDCFIMIVKFCAGDINPSGFGSNDVNIKNDVDSDYSAPQQEEHESGGLAYHCVYYNCKTQHT